MKPKLVFIVGPTASGKSQLALQLAQNLSAEIANADSVQVYCSVDIGTAKPTAEELDQVTHHLLSYVPEGEEHTAGDYRRAARELLRTASKPLLFVGGSGFYLQALERGMYDIPKGSPEIRIELETRAQSHNGLDDLHKELLTLDPEAGRRISSQDRYRILRALEVIRVSGRRLSDFEREWAERGSEYEVLKIGLRGERESLRQRVCARAQSMRARGLLSEVEALRARGLGNWAPMRSVGYRECQDYLDGQIAETDLWQRIVTSTMQLAKKQMTWFRRDSSIEWWDFMAFDDREIQRKISDFLQ